MVKQKQDVQQVGWFVVGPSQVKGYPYAYGDVFLSVYTKEEQRKFYQDRDCKLVPVFVPKVDV